MSLPRATRTPRSRSRRTGAVPLHRFTLDAAQWTAHTPLSAMASCSASPAPSPAQEGTEESLRETLRWLEACRFAHIRPILTPRFIPSCTDGLLKALGELARERDLPVQSHLSENQGEIALVSRLHPDCAHYWEGYRKFGLWKEGTLMAHCVHSGEPR